MELRLNVALLAALGLLWAGLSSAEPVAALDPGSPGRAELARLEDAVAQDPSDLAQTRRLAEAYLDLGRPGLAIAVLRAGDPTLLESPMLSHRLAQAYEQSGRVLDAYATAEVALARCARSLGTADSSLTTPVPRYACGARDYAVLEMHRAALGHMVRAGVADPARDPRTQLAYDLAMRRASIASAR